MKCACANCVWQKTENLQGGVCKMLGKLVNGVNRIVVLSKQKSPPEGRLLSKVSAYYLWMLKGML